MDAESSEFKSIPRVTFSRVPSTARRLLLGIPAREAEFARRGFHCATSHTRCHLEESGRVFLQGYNSVVAAGSTTRLLDDLQNVSSEMRGFAFEGAAMALALFDLLTSISGMSVPTEFHPPENKRQKARPDPELLPSPGPSGAY